MIDFSGNPVCLVLTCRKPYYVQRLQSNINTFIGLNSYGFKVVMLYADPSLKESVLNTNNESDFYELTVPCDDTYLHLSTKMDYAIQYFTKLGALGILKMDDDTKINNWSCINLLLNQIIYSCDYLGLDRHSFLKGLTPLYDSQFKLHYLKLYFDLPETITFFTGPFYWISKKVMEYISKEHLTFPLEDLAVGYRVNEIKDAIHIFLEDWYKNKYISISYQRESS